MAPIFIRTVQAIVAGHRDHTLAAAPDLDYMMPPKSFS